ncbi:MAG: efflux RND transporter permease subunit [Pseudomonadota bacterium]|nr:efflux RND transporter permease subunit [Pseudomonadota bacterium]
MKSGVSSWAISHERWIWLLFALLLIAGGASYFHLPVKRFPTVQLPAVAVTVATGNASPAEAERRLAEPIERAIATLPGIHKIWTQINFGQSVTVAQFENSHADRPLKQQVEMATARLKLTDGGHALSVRRLEVESTPMLAYAVTSSALPSPLLSAYVDRIVLPKLRQIEGATAVRRLGGSDQHLEISLRPADMRARKVTSLALINSLSAAPRTDASAQSLKALAIRSVDGGLVRLGDIATVEEAPDISSHLILDGEPAVGFSVAKSPRGDSLQLAAKVAALAAELEQARPDMSFTKAWSSADETAAALRSTRHALFEGMFLASLVVFLFLRDIRATLVVAIAMPVSLVPTFFILYAAGYSLNIVTMLALTLSVGILVDDAIVEVENIQRLVKSGASPREAAPIGADSIAPAVIATTAAIVAVFAPVSFMPGVAGRFFSEFGLTVATAVIMSLLVARLLTPILAMRLMKSAPSASHSKRPPLYEKLLHQVVAKPRTAIIAVIGIVGASIALVPLLPTEFQPSPEPDYYSVSVVTRPGSGTDALQVIAKQAVAIVAARPETRHVMTHLGATPEGGGAAGISLGAPPSDPRSARIIVAVDPDRDASLMEIRSMLRPAFRRLTGGSVITNPPTEAADLQLLLSSDDPGALARSRKQLLEELRDVPSVVDARGLLQGLASSPAVERPLPQISLMPGEYGAALALATSGKQLGEAYTDDGNLLPVHVRAPVSAVSENFPALPVQASNGEIVSMASAGPSIDELRATILRLDGKRVDGVDVDLATGAASGDALEAIDRLPAIANLPSSVSRVPTGDQAEMDILLGSMALAFAVAVLAIYLTLALLFRSCILPLIVVASLPLALGGAVLGLFASGSALNLPALIGFLLLLGLAAKNSILLVEHAARRVRGGMSVRDSIIDAAHRRSRAIVMTSVAMAAGMLPAAYALGPGDEFRQPMAFAVIGGLISSTMLSLLFVPALFVAAFAKRGLAPSKPL